MATIPTKDDAIRDLHRMVDESIADARYWKTQARDLMAALREIDAALALKRDYNTVRNIVRAAIAKAQE